MHMVDTCEHGHIWAWTYDCMSLWGWVVRILIHMHRCNMLGQDEIDQASIFTMKDLVMVTVVRQSPTHLTIPTLFFLI